MINQYSDIKYIPKNVEDIYFKYLSISTPYYQHRQRLINKFIFSPAVYKGKGTPEEIKATLEKLKGNENKLSNKEILEKNNIGIDCSGFVSHLLNEYTKSKFSKEVSCYFKRKEWNPIKKYFREKYPIVAKLNADTLTSEVNCIKIDKTKDIQPLDLIRMSGGRHLVMVYRTYYKDNTLKLIEYVHSTEGIGVCNGLIEVIDENKSIIDQNWIPYSDEEKPRYQPNNLIRLRVNSNGIRRPKFIENHG